MAEQKHRISIAECETLMREGLRAMPSSYPEFEVVGEASDGMAVIRATEKTRPDLILILVLTIHNGEKHVKEVFKLGGNGYCLKDDVCQEELCLAIRKVLDGKPYLSPSILPNVLDVYLKEGKELGNGPLRQLSCREKDVLKLIGEGRILLEPSQRKIATRAESNLMYFLIPRLPGNTNFLGQFFR